MQESKKQNKTIKGNNNSKLSYLSYTFQSFFKKPFGYIIALLYVIYLAVILLIVPATQNFSPLFIWTIGGFNIPILNLIFISAAAASIVVAVFRTGRDDGTDLLFSSKPLTKLSTVLIKTVVYVSIMLVLSGLCLLITALTLPVFGEYSIISNPTGISFNNYVGLMLSVLIGNIVNMLFFGSIACFISLFGKQVIILITTITLSFLLLIINFLLPVISSSPLKVLSDKYNSEIYSISCNTLSQFNKENTDYKSFASIQCTTDDDGIEDPNTHFDTYEYWTKATIDSHSYISNYFDFGKQLSSLFSAFGLDNEKLQEASKLSIGINNSFKYSIDKSTAITSHISTLDYPISIYKLTQDRGKTFPKLKILGGNMSLESDNWYLWSKICNLNFNSVSFASLNEYGDKPSGFNAELRKTLNNKYWNRMSDLFLSKTEMAAITDIYAKALESYLDDQHVIDLGYANFMMNEIGRDKSNIFFPEGTFDDLSIIDSYKIVSKIHLYLCILAQYHQNQLIAQYWKSQGKDFSFPFTSYQVNEYFKNTALKQDQSNFLTEKFIELVFENSIQISKKNIEGGTSSDILYDRMLECSMTYAETYTNLYQYTVSQFYSIWTLLGVWSSLSVILFGASIIVYKKTDFK